jgi:hypothetical protein
LGSPEDLPSRLVKDPLDHQPLRKISYVEI